MPEKIKEVVDDAVQAEPSDADVLAVLKSGKVPEGEGQPADRAGTQDPTPEGDDKPDSFEANARLERQNRELRDKLKKLDELQEAAKEGPMQALQKLGIDPLDLLDSMDDATPSPPEEGVQTELEKLREEQNRLKAELERSKYDGYVSKRKDDLMSKMSELKEDHPFAHMAAASDESFLDNVLEYAGQYYKQNNELIADADLVKAADGFIVDMFYKQLNDILSVPAGVQKVKEAISKLEGHSSDAPTQSTQQKPAPTLSNDMNADPARGKRDLTDEESEAEFIRLMQKDGWVGDD